MVIYKNGLRESCCSSRRISNSVYLTSSGIVNSVAAGMNSKGVVTTFKLDTSALFNFLQTIIVPGSKFKYQNKLYTDTLYITVQHWKIGCITPIVLPYGSVAIYDEENSTNMVQAMACLARCLKNLSQSFSRLWDIMWKAWKIKGMPCTGMEREKFCYK